MKDLFSIFCLSYISTLSYAQPTIQWQTALGGSQLDEVLSIRQTIDGGYITAGYTQSNNGDVVGNHGSYDFWIVKFAETGSVEWKKTYGGTSTEWAFSIDQTSDEGYIVAGYTQSNDGNVSGNHGDKDAWVVKLDNAGAIEWEKTLGGSGWDEAWSVRQTSDGGYIVGGRSNSYNGDVTGNNGGLDYWVVKLGNSGAIEWQHSLGGSAEDDAYAVWQTLDGGYIIAGESLSHNGDVTGSHGDADYWVVKLSPNGNLEWQKAFGGSGLDRGNDITPTDDGGYIVIGQTSSNNGDVAHHYGGYDIWAVKIDALGEIQWQKTLGGSNQDWGQSVQQTKDGGYVIAGTTQSTDGDVLDNDGVLDFWVVKLDGEGNIQWQKTLGGSLGERANSICQTTDGGYFIGGSAWSGDGDVTGHHAQSDFWVVKLSPETISTEDHETKPIPLEIYPNPTQYSISIKIPFEERTIKVSVSDLLGRELLLETIPNGVALDLSRLKNGLYMVKATTPSGGIYAGKVQRN